jgi:hypothetical protein
MPERGAVKRGVWSSLQVLVGMPMPKAQVPEEFEGSFLHVKMRKMLRDLISARTTNTDVRLTYVRVVQLQWGATVDLKALDPVITTLGQTHCPTTNMLREGPSKGDAAAEGVGCAFVCLIMKPLVCLIGVSVQHNPARFD